MSKFEEHIMRILLEEKINFIREKTFSDLKNGKYRYDFYLPNKNICIECDGAQHFTQTKIFHKTKKDFLKQQEHDRRKNSYCLANNILLYRIPYYDINNIKDFNDIIQEKYKVNSKWHNDFLIENRRKK